MKKINENDRISLVYYFSLLGQIGAIIVLNILGALLLYLYIVKKFFGENVFLMVILILLGIFNGFYRVYRLIFKK